jgi:hypothetical protein
LNGVTRGSDPVVTRQRPGRIARLPAKGFGFHLGGPNVLRPSRVWPRILRPVSPGLDSPLSFDRDLVVPRSGEVDPARPRSGLATRRKDIARSTNADGWFSTPLPSPLPATPLPATPYHYLLPTTQRRGTAQCPASALPLPPCRPPLRPPSPPKPRRPCTCRRRRDHRSRGRSPCRLRARPFL